MHYLIIQRGLYWRSDAKGYTKDIGEAGIYREDYAKKIENNKREPPDVALPLTITNIKSLKEEKERCLNMVNNLDGMITLIEAGC